MQALGLASGASAPALEEREATPPTTPPAAKDGAAASECRVCFAQPRGVLFLPCQHLVCCAGCAERLPQPRRCPACRAAVESAIQVFTP